MRSRSSSDWTYSRFRFIFGISPQKWKNSTDFFVNFAIFVSIRRELLREYRWSRFCRPYGLPSTGKRTKSSAPFSLWATLDPKN